jgi:hypothetical protein
VAQDATDWTNTGEKVSLDVAVVAFFRKYTSGQKAKSIQIKFSFFVFFIVYFGSVREENGGVIICEKWAYKIQHAFFR